MAAEARFVPDSHRDRGVGRNGHDAPAPDHSAELDAILDHVETAGLVEVYTDEHGKQSMRPTPDGECVVRQRAMLGDVGHDPLMDALLEGRRAGHCATCSRGGAIRSLSVSQKKRPAQRDGPR